MTVEASALSLRQLLPLSLEERAKLIMAHGAMDLARSVHTLEQDGLTVPKDLQERIAWAVAWNIDAGGSKLAEDTALRRVRDYRHQWSLDTTWEKVWRELTAPLEGSKTGPNRMLLDELALSVLCEQREEWQPEASRPLDLGLADDALDFVYKRDNGKVIGFLRKKFRNWTDELEELAQEAWEGIIKRYWSTESRRRFLGLSKISSLVCTAAENKGKDILRKQKRQGKQVSLEQSGSHPGEESGTPLSELIGVEIDPGEQIMMEELRQRLDECMQALSPHQQIVAQLIWLQERPAKSVAEQLRVSEPAISQRVKKARESLRACLEHHGYRMFDR